MLEYKYTVPSVFEGRNTGNESSDFIISTAMNNLLQNQCSASIIKGEYLYEFFLGCSPDVDRKVTYTEADIFKQISDSLINYILSNKNGNRESLSKSLLRTSFSVDSKSRLICYKTELSDFKKSIESIAKKENYGLMSF